ncbi:MAG TPA: D-alanyl-D-alanine carboxypeptidase/D-alanyl-D-alanine-endopeptidase [Longimicrobiales bacterium]|nr:D-alanyl-D-alanine carboxypeptidase/D-alanyl-D-alanine-endopeptidase [Longimicrobiales bacterium]
MRRPGLLWTCAAVLALSAAVPVAPGSAVVAGLGDDLRSVLSSYRWRTAHWSVLVVSLDQGDTLFALDPDSSRAPASNMKLLTSAAALQALGPDFRYRTYLVTQGRIDDGVLDGDLVLYGTGDPGLSDRFYHSKTTVFETLADTLLASGITTVRGDLVGDRSFFPEPLRPEGWDPADLNDHFAAAVSALSFNENVVSIRVEAAGQAGWKPIVHTIPDHAGLNLVNDAVTVEERGRVFIGRDEPMAPILLQGRIQRGGRDVWRELTVSDPAAYAVSVFRAVLADKGITVLGEDRLATTAHASTVGGVRLTAPAVTDRPRTRILATHVSPPLRDYLAVVNKKSHNLFTELIFRTMGRYREGAGTPEASARAVAAALRELGVDTTGVVQLDGSGLSAGNRVRASTFVSLFGHIAESELWGELWATLPEAGNRRELARMYRTLAAGNLRAKTGTIEGVSALSGVVQSRDGERLAFSILVNGTPSTSRAKRIENDIGVRLASFTRGPGAFPASRVTQLPPPPVPLDSGGPARHLVEQGESFDGIARRYGLTLEELMRANASIRPRRLQAGTWIIVPSGSGGDSP